MTTKPNPHKGSSVEDFLKEEGIEVLCKICKKEKAAGMSRGDIAILVCELCNQYIKDGLVQMRLFTMILERLENLEEKA